MEQFRERTCPETIQLEEYLRRRKQGKNQKQSIKSDDIIKENAEWIMTAFSL